MACGRLRNGWLRTATTTPRTPAAATPTWLSTVLSRQSGGCKCCISAIVHFLAAKLHAGHHAQSSSKAEVRAGMVCALYGELRIGDDSRLTLNVHLTVRLLSQYVPRFANNRCRPNIRWSHVGRRQLTHESESTEACDDKANSIGRVYVSARTACSLTNYSHEPEFLEAYDDHANSIGNKVFFKSSSYIHHAMPDP